MKRIKHLCEVIADWYEEWKSGDMDWAMTLFKEGKSYEQVELTIMGNLSEWLRYCEPPTPFDFWKIVDDIKLKDLMRHIINTAWLRRNPKDDTYFRPAFTGRAEQVFSDTGHCRGEIVDHGELWAAWVVATPHDSIAKDMAVFDGYHRTAEEARAIVLKDGPSDERLEHYREPTASEHEHEALAAGAEDVSPSGAELRQRPKDKAADKATEPGTDETKDVLDEEEFLRQLKEM